MNDRPPFDPLRAGFWLVAFVIGVHSLVILLGVILCIWHLAELPPGAEFTCDAKGRLGDLLAGALASALAFAGGLGRRPTDPPK